MSGRNHPSTKNWLLGKLGVKGLVTWAYMIIWRFQFRPRVKTFASCDRNPT